MKLVHLVGFTKMKYVTVHGHMNIKLGKVTLNRRHLHFSLILQIKSNDSFRQKKKQTKAPGIPTVTTAGTDTSRPSCNVPVIFVEF